LSADHVAKGEPFISSVQDDIDLIRRELADLFWAARDASSEEPSCDVAQARDRMGQYVADILVALNSIEVATRPGAKPTNDGRPNRCEVSR
jgi:hypothetical protein